MTVEVARALGRFAHIVRQIFWVIAGINAHLPSRLAFGGEVLRRTIVHQPCSDQGDLQPYSGVSHL